MLVPVLRRIRRRILKAFGRAQRPLAWTLLVLSLAAFVGIVSTLWKVDDPVGAALTAAVLLWQGIESVMEVENELDSEGSAESDDPGTG